MTNRHWFALPRLRTGSTACIGPLLANRHWLTRYFAALVCVASCAAIRYALIPVLGDQAPLMPFVLVVLVSVILGGLGPGLFATLLSCVVEIVVLIPWPHGADLWASLAHGGYFLLVCASICGLVVRLQAAAIQERALLANTELARQETIASAAQIRDIATALRESERTLKLIYDNASDCFYLVKVEAGNAFRFVSVNATFLKVTGYAREQAENRLMEEIVPFENHALVRAKYLEVIQTRGKVVYEETALLPAGLRHGEITLVPIENYGKVDLILGSIKDVTATKEAQAQIKEASERKDKFLATLAHELRNPLAPIRHTVKILQSPVANEEQRQWGQQVIDRQTTHMAMLLDDLLDASRINRGRLELKKAYVQLDTLVAAAVEVAGPMIAAKAQSLQIDLPSAGIGLEVDPLRISQVLSNLLTNASKYTDNDGHISLMAQLEQGPVDHGLLIAIRDSGIGLSSDHIPKLFEMFSQVDTAIDRSQNGLGIGLALVKGFVELHGGRVEALSKGLGFGSEFVVHLPQRLIIDRTHPQPTAVDPARVESKGLQILIADDNRDAAESLAIFLSLAGHTVHTASSGALALELAEKIRPNAVILDIGMPGLSGYDVARRIRGEAWEQRPLIIAATGWNQESDRRQATAAGFDHHLTKPVDTEKLQSLLHEFAKSRIAGSDVPA
ncbi:MAG TPA: ATP-binding protein [Steroidobacteraceae bacterium]|nr:ATP-binding protein [Steroidobacteraceae bacterium]